MAKQSLSIVSVVAAGLLGAPPAARAQLPPPPGPAPSVQAPAGQAPAGPSLPQLRRSFSDGGASEQFSWVMALVDGLKSCRAERLAADRTRCYDELVDKSSSTLTEPPAKAQDLGNWHLETGADGSVAAGVAAVFVEGDSDELSRMKVALFLRCRGSQLDLYLAFGRKVANRDEPFDVAIHGGGMDRKPEPWEPSTAGTALGLWGTERSLPVVRQLMRERNLSVRLAMPGDKTLFVSFDLLGLETALAPVQRACKISW